MKISLNWIKDFVNLEGIEIKDIWYRFTMSAAEVEDVLNMGEDIKKVVVGLVTKAQKISGSEKLTLCSVNTGKEEYISVCGAPNVREGMKVPFALPGGNIKRVGEVKIVNIAGVESSGVICSPAELGISDRHEGVLELPQSFGTGTDIKQVMDIDDIIIEIDNKSLTNRPDLWGHYGIAREMAAIFSRKLKPLEVYNPGKVISGEEPDISIEDTDKCYRYSSVCIENIMGGKTPFNMQIRLFYCGMRPIDAIVDLTNYVMLEMGQPMHAFDRKRIKKVIVKATDETSKFTTLDGVERNIPKETLMIYNENGPVAIAGIMGGENSEVCEDTKAIFLESASFSGAAIRRGSMGLGLRTEASSRFEKSLDPEMTLEAVKRFIKLFRDIKGDIKIASPLTDIYPFKLAPLEINITKQYIDKYIGQSLKKEKIIEILKSLEFKVKNEEDSFLVTVPSFRSTKDVTIKADLVEEITRIYGYDNIEPKTVEVVLQPLDYNEQRILEHRVRDYLSEGSGFSEVNSYIWYDDDFNSRIKIKHEGSLKILNPHAESMNILRDSIMPSMLQFAEKNTRFFDRFSIYEMGGTFKKGKDGKCEERKRLCVFLADRNVSEDILFYKLKGITSHMIWTLKKTEMDYTRSNTGFSWMHPAKSVDIVYKGKTIGYITVIHPVIGGEIDKKLKMAAAEIDMEDLGSITEVSIKHTEPSKYPEVNLDFSFLVDIGISYERLTDDIDGFKNSLLISWSFIDIYLGKGLPDGKKSITFRFVIGSRERTLSSEEISRFSESILIYMKENGYSLR